MIALDTNVVVRIVTRDDRRQARMAVAAVRGKRLWLAKTVLLETEWVLRHAYRLRRDAVLRAFRTVMGYPKLDVEDRVSVLKALDWYSAGMDLADALHLASSAGADRFVTFDERLASTARAAGGVPKVDLLS